MTPDEKCDLLWQKLIELEKKFDLTTNKLLADVERLKAHVEKVEKRTVAKKKLLDINAGPNLDFIHQWLVRKERSVFTPGAIFSRIPRICNVGNTAVLREALETLANEGRVQRIEYGDRKTQYAVIVDS